MGDHDGLFVDLLNDGSSSGNVLRMSNWVLSLSELLVVELVLMSVNVSGTVNVSFLSVEVVVSGSLTVEVCST